MRTSEPFHPDLRRASLLLPRGAVSPWALPVIRRLMSLQRPPKDAETVTAGGVPLLVYRPPGRPRSAALWIHGGGMVIGTAAQDAAVCRRLRDELGLLVAAPDYRLAPEHPYPAPLDDCYGGLRWLAGQSGRVVVAGASAGGGLAAGVVLRARDEGIPVAGQVLVYPMLDDRTASRPDPDDELRRLWNNRANAFGWRSYLGGAHPVAEYAAPARAVSVAGLPPTWIGVGTLDLFHDEAMHYAERLHEAGVPCDLEIVPGAFHGFDAVRSAAVSRAFVDAQVAAVANLLSDRT